MVQFKTKICTECKRRKQNYDFPLYYYKAKDRTYTASVCKSCVCKKRQITRRKNGVKPKILNHLNRNNLSRKEIEALIDGHLMYVYSQLARHSILPNTPFYEDKKASAIEVLVKCANYWRPGKTTFISYLSKCLHGRLLKLMFEFNLLHWSEHWRWVKYKDEIKSIIRLGHTLNDYEAYEIADNRTPLTELIEKESSSIVRERFKQLTDDEFEFALKFSESFGRRRTKQEWRELARLAQKLCVKATIPTTGYSKPLDNFVTRFRLKLKRKV